MIERIVFLSGGVGGARFARALDGWRSRRQPELEITAIVNVGDDFSHLGLSVSPDIDSVTYQLAGLGDRVRGWGREGDSSTVFSEVLERLPEAGWFQLGDLDIAHNAMRTHLLQQGHPLSAATAILNAAYGVGPRVLPATDDSAPTRVVLDSDGAQRELGFQEWWVRDRAEPAPLGFALDAATRARPAPGVIEAIEDADLIVIAPSNPAVSIAPILEIPGILYALLSARAPVIGISPIIGGRPVRGYADRCLEAIGVECSAAAVAAHYGARRSGGLIDGWLADVGDQSEAYALDAPVQFAPLLFTQSEQDDLIIDSLLTLAGQTHEWPQSGLLV